MKLYVNHGGTKKSPNKLSAMEIKNWYNDLLTNGENLSQDKNSTGWISYHHSQKSTNQEQTVTSIRNLITTLAYPKIPTYS